MCEHEDFAAEVNTHRLTKEEGGAVVGYAVEIKLTCSQCGLPFKFDVPDVGQMQGKACTSVDGQELRVFAEPSDGTLAKAVIAGFTISGKPSESRN